LLRDKLLPLTYATSQLIRAAELRPTDHLIIWIKKDWFHAKIKCQDEFGWELFQPGVSREARDVFRRMPECRRDRIQGCYIFSATDFNALILYHAWPLKQITFKDEESRVVFETLLLRFLSQTDRANQQAEFKVQGVITPPPSDWRTHKKHPLADYQTAGCLFCLGSEGSALFMDRGTGKTAVTIQRVCMEAARSDRMLRVLVVVPRQVRENWKREFARFAVLPGKSVVARGGQADRVKALVQGVTEEDDLGFGAVIISFDSAARSIKVLQQIPWDGIIVDESQKFKSSSTDRWKALRELRANSKWRMILSGSPVGNSPMDLWTQLEFLGEGFSGFKTFKAFRRFHGIWKDLTGTPGVQKLIGLQNVPLLQERLSRLAFQVTKEETGLQLPDKVYDVREVEMTKKQASIYKATADELVVEFEDKLSGDVDEMVMRNVLTQLLRLAQITSGFVTWDPIIDPMTGIVTREKRIEWLSDAKIDAVIEDLKVELEEDPLAKKIVWAVERPSLRRLHEKAEKALSSSVGLYYGDTSDAERERLERAFNLDPNFRVLIANQMTAGEGLDLIGYDKDKPDTSETYCDHEIFFSQNWSGLLRAQAEDRAHRRGTRVPVRITDYTVVGSVDEEIRQRVTAKIEMAKSITDVRDVLKSVLGLDSTTYV
jgi:SNF2 family DNA or RNA helicase